jgi:uncharacterized protein (DUF433 family)
MAKTIAAVQIDPDIQAGTPCFAGTRVPIASLFTVLAHGRTMDYFLDQFPSVKREQAEQVLEEARKSATAIDEKLRQSIASGESNPVNAAEWERLRALAQGRA